MDDIEVKYDCVQVGPWSTDWIKFMPTSSYDTVTLVIPGNPGIVRYYEIFCSELFKQLQGTSAVWAISHTCHTEADAMPNSSVQREVQHKLMFIKKFLPEGYKLRLIGHSIGCEMIIEILDGLNNLSPSQPSSDGTVVKVNLKKCYLLFPTVEKMKISPNGKRLWPILAYAWWLPPLLANCLSILPNFIHKKLACIFLHCDGTNSIPESIIQSFYINCRPDMVQNMLSLAYDELQNVVELKTSIIERYADQLVFYYGMTDSWCPVEFRADLVKRVPGVVSHVCMKGIDHAFVVKSSVEMAQEMKNMIMDQEDQQ